MFDLRELRLNRWAAWLAGLIGLLWFALHLRAQYWMIDSARIPLAGDIAYYAQVLENLGRMRGLGGSILEAPNFFQIRFSPSFFLVAPFYRALRAFLQPPWAAFVWGDLWLLGFYSITALLAWRVYQLRGMALLSLAILTVQCSPLNYLFRFGFRDTTMSLVPIGLMIYAYEKDRPRLFTVSSLFLLGVREDVALALAGFALLGLFRRSWYWRLFPLLGVAVFLFTTMIFAPKIMGVALTGFERYAHLGGSIGEVLLSPLLKPQLFWATLFQKANFDYLQQVLGGFLFLPLLRPRLLLPALPYLFVLMLNRPLAESANFIWLPYSFAILPFFVAATIDALRMIQSRIAPWISLQMLLPLPALASIVYGTAFFAIGLPPASVHSLADSLRQARTFIPAEAPLSLNLAFAPFFSDHRDLRSIQTYRSLPEDHYLLLAKSAASPDFWFQLGTLQDYRQRLLQISEQNRPLLYEDAQLALWGPKQSAPPVSSALIHLAPPIVEAEWTPSENLNHRIDFVDGRRAVRSIGGHSLITLRPRRRGFHLISGEFSSDGQNRVQFLARSIGLQVCGPGSLPIVSAISLQSGAAAGQPWPQTPDSPSYELRSFNLPLPQGERYLLGIQWRGCGELRIDSLTLAQ
ncbi:MAG: DUF2079 domain-containing protein [Leptospirales bacterium]|nr:DUF2079 domain-containing protein [Leptospirales bacterium]